MDFDLTEEQEMLRKSARDFLEAECPKALVRAMETDAKGYSPEVWRKTAELGWLGLVFPEQYEGLQGSFMDLTVLVEEMGRALLPSPFIDQVLCGYAIMDAGSQEQKARFLPKMGSGDLITTLAFHEPSFKFNASGIKATAAKKGANYTLVGTKLLVKDAHIADYLLVVARTGGVAEDGVSLFLVDAKARGVETTLIDNIAKDKLCEVVLKGVEVPAGQLLGGEGKGWPVVEKLLLRGAILKNAEMVGGAKWVLDTTVEYAKQRVQFGRPIGAFQAIQHKCANMQMDYDGARLTAYGAAWLMSEGLPCAKEVAIAKAWVSEAYKRMCLESHQIHAGMGFTMDYDLQLYTRRAKAAELAFGDATVQREMLASAAGFE